MECMACGCTDDDCSGCVERVGAPCAWAAPHLCSACVGDVVAVGDRYVVRDTRGWFAKYDRPNHGPVSVIAGRPGYAPVPVWSSEVIADWPFWVYVRAEHFALVKALAEQGRVRL